MNDSAVLFGMVAAGFGVATTVPYVRDILRDTTRPHRGTWLIWTTLGAVGLASQWAAGAQWSLLPPIAPGTG